MKKAQTWLGASALAALMVVVAVVVGATPAEANVTLYVAPGGSGDCSNASPCGSIDAAFAHAASGVTIELASGSYGAQVVSSQMAAAQGFAQNVVVRAAAGAAVNVAGVDVNVPRLTLRGFRSTGTLRLRPTAHFSRIENMSVDGASVLVTGADNTAVINTRVRPGNNSDGLQVKGDEGDNPVGLLIQGNVIGPGRLTNGLAHVDCIQFLGGDDVVVQGNTLFDCANAAIQIGNGAGGTTHRLSIQRNFLRECTPRSATCPGYHTIIMGSENANDIKLRYNSIVGSVAVAGTASSANLVLEGNVADALPCSSKSSSNLTADVPCAGPGNRRGAVAFANPNGEVPDLHVAAASPTLDSATVAAPWGDIDGQPMCGSAPDLGADESCAGSTPPVAPTTTLPGAVTTTTTVGRPTVTTQPVTSTTRATTTTQPPKAPRGLLATFTLRLNSKQPSRTVSFRVGAGRVLIEAAHRPYGGVSTGNLNLVVYSATGTVMATGAGNLNAAIDTILPAGDYQLKVSARPGTTTATVRVP